MHPTQLLTLSDLILSQLLLADSLTKGVLKSTVKSIAASQLSASALSERIEKVLKWLEEKEYVELISKARYRRTEKGAQQILEKLGLETLPPDLSWPQLRNTDWIAYALGLPALTTETRKRLADAEGLRVAILQSEYDLPANVFSTLTETRNALLWRQLCNPSVAQSLQDQLPQLNQQAFTQGTIMEVLLNNLLQTHKPLKWDQALNQLVAKAAGARNKPDEMRLAMLRRAFTDASVEPAFEPEISDQLTSKASTHAKEFMNLALEDFSNAVLAAAVDTEEGRFGENKVFISQVWKTLSLQQPNGCPTLDVFKQRLLEASRKDLIGLSCADLAYALDTEDVTASEVVYLQSPYHFIRTD